MVTIGRNEKIAPASSKPQEVSEIKTQTTTIALPACFIHAFLPTQT
jgi:hypothetical protein